MDTTYVHQFENGLWLVAEAHSAASSLAMAFLTPCGAAHQPADRQGVASLLAEMAQRGAGDLDAKAHCDALDDLGVQRGLDVESQHMRLSATMLGDKLPQALPLLTDMLRRPRLEPAALPPARDLALQAIAALEDDPGRKVFTELRQVHFAQPYGRSVLGIKEQIEQVTHGDVVGLWRENVVPQGGIIGFAGRFDFEELKALVGEHLGDWTGEQQILTDGTPAPRGYVHKDAKTTQCHIGLAYDALPAPHDDSLLQRAAAAVLSGGMSGRLFTEVREERGLCYAVYASYAATRDRGCMLAYAGTNAPRAQQTLDVLTAELRRLSNGIEPDEFERAIVGMKSQLVMQGESTGARAHAIASDQFVYGKPRRLDEVAARVDAITLDRLNAFVAEHPPGEMTIVTVGPQPLQTLAGQNA